MPAPVVVDHPYETHRRHERINLGEHAGRIRLHLHSFNDAIPAHVEAGVDNGKRHYDVATNLSRGQALSLAFKLVRMALKPWPINNRVKESTRRARLRGWHAMPSMRRG